MLGGQTKRLIGIRRRKTVEQDSRCVLMISSQWSDPDNLVRSYEHSKKPTGRGTQESENFISEYCIYSELETSTGALAKLRLKEDEDFSTDDRTGSPVSAELGSRRIGRLVDMIAFESKIRESNHKAPLGRAIQREVYQTLTMIGTDEFMKGLDPTIHFIRRSGKRDEGDNILASEIVDMVMRVREEARKWQQKIQKCADALESGKYNRSEEDTW